MSSDFGVAIDEHRGSLRGVPVLMDIGIDACHSLYSKVKGLKLGLTLHLDERQHESSNCRIHVKRHPIGPTYVCNLGDVVNDSIGVLWGRADNKDGVGGNGLLQMFERHPLERVSGYLHDIESYVVAALIDSWMSTHAHDDVTCSSVIPIGLHGE